jgi:Protein of unknown function (DUF3396)
MRLATWQRSLSMSAELPSFVAPEMELCVYLSFFWTDLSSNDPGLALIERYLAENGSHLRWSVDETTGRPRPFEAQRVAEFCERNIRGYVPAPGEYSSAIWLGVYGGPEKRGVSPYTVTAGFQSTGRGSSLLLTWPLSRAPDWETLVSWVSAKVDSTLLLACGGLTYAYSVFDPCDGPRRHQVLPRFWGMDPPEPNQDATAAREGTRSPSWLTYVPTDKLARLPPGTLERLPAEITQTRLESGVLFRLGLVPILGDQNRGEPMPLHGALARALKPIRGKLTHWTNSTSYEYPTWVARFDAPETETTQ